MEMLQKLTTKLSKEDLSSILKLMELKVQAIQDRISTLDTLKCEREAAGTKHKLLTVVECILCHSDAAMKVVEADSIPMKVASPFKCVADLNQQIKYRIQ